MNARVKAIQSKPDVRSDKRKKKRSVKVRGQSGTHRLHKLNGSGVYDDSVEPKTKTKWFKRLLGKK